MWGGGVTFFRRLPDGGLRIIHIAAWTDTWGNRGAALFKLGGGRLTRKAYKELGERGFRGRLRQLI